MPNLWGCQSLPRACENFQGLKTNMIEKRWLTTPREVWGKYEKLRDSGVSFSIRLQHTTLLNNSLNKSALPVASQFSFEF